MFSIKQETENGEKLWPDVYHVYTTRGQYGLVVTALYGGQGLFDFGQSRNFHNVYVMNENGATVAKYVLGHNPAVPEDGGDMPLPEPLAEAA